LWSEAVQPGEGEQLAEQEDLGVALCDLVVLEREERQELFL
jgi:hypothetical protein